MFVLFTKSFLTICEHDPIGRIIKSTLDSIWKSALTSQSTRIPALHYSRRVNRWARSYLFLGLSSHPFLSHHTQVSIPITPWKLSLRRSPYPGDQSDSQSLSHPISSIWHSFCKHFLHWPPGQQVLLLVCLLPHHTAPPYSPTILPMFMPVQYKRSLSSVLTRDLLLPFLCKLRLLWLWSAVWKGH